MTTGIWSRRNTILPNQTPYRLRTGKKATIVLGKPMVFDELLAELRSRNLNAIETRKVVIDLIQEEFYKLKERGAELHKQHLMS